MEVMKVKRFSVFNVTTKFQTEIKNSDLCNLDFDVSTEIVGQYEKGVILELLAAYAGLSPQHLDFKEYKENEKTIGLIVFFEDRFCFAAIESSFIEDGYVVDRKQLPSDFN